MTIFDDLLGRRDALEDLGAHGALADARHEVARHLEVDVGLQQRHAHLAQGRGDVLLGKSPAAPKALKHAPQALGQGGQTSVVLAGVAGLLWLPAVAEMPSRVDSTRLHGALPFR